VLLDDERGRREFFCLVDRPVPLGGGVTAMPVASVWSS
jgi:hypothetical protein